MLLYALWFAFFNGQSLISRALSPRSALPAGVLLREDLALSLLWTAITYGIVRWHRWLRVRVRRAVALLAGHLPVAIAAALLDTAATRVAVEYFSGARLTTPFAATLVYYSDFDIVIYVAVVAIAEALLVRRVLLERQRATEQLEASLSRARLDYLEAQLQPHFLFNSLGAVSELAYDAPATAARVLHQLSSIFRTALAKKTDEVTLGEELVGIEPYLDIQRIRFADWLTIEYDIDDAAVDCLLPRFVLQPLIENAIRHGLSDRRAAGTIGISASVCDGALLVRVWDNGVGLEHARATSGRGIGLANVRDRLRILYGDDERLRLAASSEGGTVAELTIPVRRRSERISGSVNAGTIVAATSEAAELPVIAVPRPFRNGVVASLLIWLAFALLWTQQSFTYLSIRGELGRSTWLSIARLDGISAALWAVMTPLMMWAARRVPLRRRYFALGSIAYLIGCTAASVLHTALFHALTSPDVPLWSSQYLLSFWIDGVIACAIVAIAQRGVLLDWLREREADSAALTAELEVARGKAAQLQSIPPVLLQSLDGIAAGLRRDAAVTERQLSRLGDYVRLALECTDERGVTPERARALESAVAALRDSGAYSHHLTLSV
ncbi:MAG TPA: histidine kinase [Gemmatimonadaceae bacterium]|nr:histidine kinase [Gemmatimonadaceae bacterium]